MAAFCVDFSVVGVRPSATRFLYRILYLLCGEEPVAGDADEEDFGADARVRFFFGLIAARHVVEVHSPGEVEVGVGIKAAGELASLVLEVALDLEATTELGVQGGTSRWPPGEPLPLPR